MKNFILVILALNCFAFTAASADGPRIEPGPVMELDENSVDAIEALLMAKASDFNKFKSAGNMTKKVTIQHLRPMLSEYVFERFQCNRGGVAGGLCLGGARLTVLVKVAHNRNITEVTATSKVELFRGR